MGINIIISSAVDTEDGHDDHVVRMEECIHVGSVLNHNVVGLGKKRNENKTDFIVSSNDNKENGSIKNKRIS